jgi:hypothetical protein
MTGPLQVRQGIRNEPAAVYFAIHWGPWITVQSAGWLWGYVIADSGMVYEFRNEPLEDTAETRA